MATHLPDERLIEEKTRQLLRRAETRGRFPTPVDDIVAAAGLAQPKESLFSGSVLAEAPSHVRRAIQKLSGRVRAVLDRRTHEVHVDPGIRSQGRVAFHKLHEVTHEILPWQQELAYADDDATLSPSVHQLFEWEANIGASNLLFQNEYFDDLVRQYQIGIAAIMEIAQTVGASGHATFRRFARVHDGAVAGVVMDLSPCSREPLAYRRHEVVVSDDWTKEFGASWPAVLRAQPYTFVHSADQARSSAGAIRTYWALPNLRNETISLDVEVYSNQYEIFVLISKPRRELLRRRTLLVGVN
jgi:hypothetical protein